MTFHDHFSEASEAYRAHRPDYPAELFDFLAGACRRTELAWDCGAGSGQASAALTRSFDHVVGSDGSLNQLSANGTPEYSRVVCLSESCALRDDCADLVTVAQALHWFRFDDFYSEARRVARRGAVVAAWTYTKPSITPDVDAVVADFHTNRVGPYWPPERRHVDAAYRTIPFPFRRMATPELHSRKEMTGEAFMAYVGTWSATRRAQAALSEDPLAAFADRLSTAWGDLDRVREISWRLHMLVGRVDS